VALLRRGVIRDRCGYSRRRRSYGAVDRCGSREPLTRTVRSSAAMSQSGSDPKAAENVTPAGGQFISTSMRSRGFLPEQDPLISFPSNSEFGALDEIGRDLPSLLQDSGFRAYLRSLDIPLWPENRASASDVPELRLYYLRVGSSPPPTSTRWVRNRVKCCRRISRCRYAAPASC